MDKKKIRLSVAMAVRNEEGNIEACLSSISDIADEIVVVDGGSLDKTVDLAQKFHATIIRTDNPPIFHINKQKALDACHGVWILQLDADEVVTPELKEEIRLTMSDKQLTNHGYYIPRKNYFLKTWLSKGGQYPDYVIRLVKKGFASFPCKSVHEQIHIEGTVGYLKHPLLHYSYRTLDEYWKKADTYTTLTARELLEKNLSPGVWNGLLYMVLKPIQTFFTIYIRHKGCVDGVAGFQFALFSAMHHLIAYRKFIKLTHSRS